MTRALPERPWQRINADLLTHKTQCYMAVSDEYSRWLEIMKMNTTTSSAVITEFKKLFACWGFPDILTCDNGTQFVSSEFRKLLMIVISSVKHQALAIHSQMVVLRML